MLNSLLQMHLKCIPKAVIQKTAEATGDLIANKIDRTMKVSRSSSQNHSETIKSEHDKEI